ncbi:hypothetical protein CCH79_00004530 [Gambusia affinis]|uniref:Uncharacterized protein n=1 Tax=Gambusia affinis TaxID=33528 RepID=A0A315UXP8_GAMAF|nr:hypothetical protein CCH79_00004530 [Gambusia affinis]
MDDSFQLEDGGVTKSGPPSKPARRQGGWAEESSGSGSAKLRPKDGKGRGLQEDELLRTLRTIACDHKPLRDQMMEELKLLERLLLCGGGPLNTKLEAGALEITVLRVTEIAPAILIMSHTLIPYVHWLQVQRETHREKAWPVNCSQLPPSLPAVVAKLGKFALSFLGVKPSSVLLRSAN